MWNWIRNDGTGIGDAAMGVGEIPSLGDRVSRSEGQIDGAFEDDPKRSEVPQGCKAGRLTFAPRGWNRLRATHASPLP